MLLNPADSYVDKVHFSFSNLVQKENLQISTEMMFQKICRMTETLNFLPCNMSSGADLTINATAVQAHHSKGLHRAASVKPGLRGFTAELRDVDLLAVSHAYPSRNKIFNSWHRLSSFPIGMSIWSQSHTSSATFTLLHWWTVNCEVTSMNVFIWSLWQMLGTHRIC